MAKDKPQIEGNPNDRSPKKLPTTRTESDAAAESGQQKKEAAKRFHVSLPDAYAP